MGQKAVTLTCTRWAPGRTTHYAGPHYKRNVGNGVDTSDTVTKMYWAQLGSMSRLVAVRKGGVLSYLHHDHLGSTKTVTGGSQAFKHYPYGPMMQEPASPPTDNLYTGQKRPAPACTATGRERISRSIRFPTGRSMLSLHSRMNACCVRRQTMVRTQVQLTEEQARALREIATERGVSISELVRQGVERVLQERVEAEKWRRVLSLIGRYSDPEPDVSTDHDRYLDEAYR